MGWKLFALFNVVFTSWVLTDPDPGSSTRMIDLAGQVLATIGLVLMAFKIDVLPGRFWQGFAGAYLAYYFAVLAAYACIDLYQRYPMNGEAGLAYALFHFAVGYALWRNGARDDQHGDVRQLTAYEN